MSDKITYDNFPDKVSAVIELLDQLATFAEENDEAIIREFFRGTHNAVGAFVLTHRELEQIEEAFEDDED